jgi:EmrB/QacA subfamily drug resistance transporter
LEAPVTQLTPLPSSSRRWAVLAVMCLAVFVTVLDGTIVNVALPTLSRNLAASTRSLQWIVDAYLLVFTGLLLAAGGLGDRFGRRRALVSGLILFGATSAFAGSARSVGMLITGRALMGVGAALIFPATLAVITNVFTDAAERAKAIGVWGAASGVAVAAGPIIGGWLLEHFWWGSVFFVNVPIALVAGVATLRIVPESRDSHVTRLDFGGLFCSIAAFAMLVYTIIEAPSWGWGSGTTLGGFALSALLLGGFIGWELRTPHPMLPVRIFENRRFSAASVSIASAFFALFGFIFLITQYFQIVRRYTPLGAGVRTLPVAISIAVASIVAPRIVHRLGTTAVVTTGLSLMALAFVWISTVSSVTPYFEIIGQMVLLGAGLGCTTAPATESIMGSLSPDKAGVGSAVNDTTRELGGTLGVAIIGSVFSSVYVHALNAAPAFAQLPPAAQHATRDSVGAAASVAARLGPQAPAYLHEVAHAFLSGLGVACLVAAGVAGAGAVFAARFLPAQAHRTERAATSEVIEVAVAAGD